MPAPRNWEVVGPVARRLVTVGCVERDCTWKISQGITTCAPPSWVGFAWYLGDAGESVTASGPTPG